MKLPSKKAIEYVLKILEWQISELESYIDMYPKDSDAAEDGGWNIQKNHLKEVIDWLSDTQSILVEEPKLDDKKKADGFCKIISCRAPVPPSNTNLFYCSEECRVKVWNYNHPVYDWYKEFVKDLLGIMK